MREVITHKKKNNEQEQELLMCLYALPHNLEWMLKCYYCSLMLGVTLRCMTAYKMMVK